MAQELWRQVYNAYCYTEDRDADSQENYTIKKENNGKSEEILAVCWPLEGKSCCTLLYMESLCLLKFYSQKAHSGFSIPHL